MTKFITVGRSKSRRVIPLAKLNKPEPRLKDTMADRLLRSRKYQDARHAERLSGRPGPVVKTMDDIVRLSKAAGGNFFVSKAEGAYGSRLYPDVRNMDDGRVLFISSVKYEGEPIRFDVMEFRVDVGVVENAGTCMYYDSGADAVQAMKTMGDKFSSADVKRRTAGVGHLDE